ncbi:hypothetical protein [Flavobacterium beibuense]|uniref:hypothetical protein n=1 Tax=Flavobacterium beibuense TaxID=657326 RepID=UPI003A909AD0
MENFDTLLEDNGELLDLIPNYQKEILTELLEESNQDYIKVAEIWLSSNSSQTAKFGSLQNNSKLYIEKLWDEIEKFLCGSESYSEERKKISSNSEQGKKYIISIMSAAIGSNLGVAGTFIAPVIILVLSSIGKMAVNAWCELRKELKNK